MQQQTTANFALNSSPGTVTGIITDACAGNPVSGALVLVLDGQVIVGFDVTDSNGVYTVATLAPGTYTVMAAKRNFVTQSATVDVISNQTTTLNFVLTPMALPPASIAGCLVCDKYLTQTNYVHKISWTASPGLCVTGYYVYRNGKQIAFVSSSEKLKYVDCAYNKKTATYAVRTINFFGQISASLSITLG
ncbi:MAG: carboxypeptidase-like regulatory domain-containing protein [Candidatus Dependentiae bacterium]|nr:carboxypeptidase-like regulatory domain-containing protein [Candidatus Dependentiae bacterium]